MQVKYLETKKMNFNVYGIICRIFQKDIYTYSMNEIKIFQ